jgi:hypothetical protein
MSNFDQLSQNASLEVNITTKEGFACGCTSTFVNCIGLGWFFHLSSLSLCLPSALCAWVLSYVHNDRDFILSNLCSSAFVGGSLDTFTIYLLDRTVVYVHCRNGQDRSGVTVYALLRVLFLLGHDAALLAMQGRRSPRGEPLLPRADLLTECQMWIETLYLV